MTRHPDCEVAGCLLLVGKCQDGDVCVLADEDEKESEMQVDESEILSRSVGACATAMHEAENQFGQLSDRERKIAARMFLDGVKSGAGMMRDADELVKEGQT